MAEGDGFETAYGGCYNSNQGLVWSNDNVAAGLNFGMSYNFARTYCADLTEGGKTDWRLPTSAEFKDAAFDGGQFYLNYGYGASNSRWTSTFGTGKNKSRVEVVSLADGGSRFTSTTSSLFGFCVRVPVAGELP